MYMIDRFEGNYAVLETDGGFLEISRSELPESAAEGDVLIRSREGWEVDAAATACRRRQILERRRKISGGDAP